MSDKLELFRENTFVTKEFNDYLENLTECLSSISFTSVITPATGATTFTEDEFDAGVSLDVKIQIQNDQNEVAEFLNCTKKIDLVNASTNFTLQIDDEDAEAAGDPISDYELEFVDGEANFTLTIGGTWEASQDITLKIDDANAEKVLGLAIEVDDHVIISSAAA